MKDLENSQITWFGRSANSCTQIELRAQITLGKTQGLHISYFCFPLNNLLQIELSHLSFPYHHNLPNLSIQTDTGGKEPLT